MTTVEKLLFTYRRLKIQLNEAELERDKALSKIDRYKVGQVVDSFSFIVLITLMTTTTHTYIHTPHHTHAHYTKHTHQEFIILCYT